MPTSSNSQHLVSLLGHLARISGQQPDAESTTCCLAKRNRDDLHVTENRAPIFSCLHEVSHAHHEHTPYNRARRGYEPTFQREAAHFSLPSSYSWTPSSLLILGAFVLAALVFAAHILVVLINVIVGPEVCVIALVIALVSPEFSA